ncbi:RHS repeat domain-containing protein [Capnocytophaga sp. ARDL2]|uniref:RHS repeat domain-containing protein n=1 Tax=Capnocytophaga sp. ARDL2 TaxID=3238809 RepID=UPI0035584FE1
MNKFLKTLLLFIECLIQIPTAYAQFENIPNDIQQDPQNCLDQLNAIDGYLANDPSMTDCYTLFLNIVNHPDYNYCQKLYAVNGMNCQSVQVVEVILEAPVYTQAEIDELDCLNQLEQLYVWTLKKITIRDINENLIYLPYGDCYKHNIISPIIEYFRLDESNRQNPCEFLAYIQSFLPCEPTPTLQEPEPTPTEPIQYTPAPVVQPSVVIQYEPPINPPSDDLVFYYHSDPLGTTTYATDVYGRPVAYNEYLPFGEQIVEHNQTTNFNNGYKFNAKEQDEATGMYYYGARYFDPRLSVFISVDPLAEEFVGWTPYHYVHQNPANLIDPDGRNAKAVVKGNTIIVKTTIYIRGYNATAKKAKSIENGIKSFWGKNFTYKDKETNKIYKVVFDINVKPLPTDKEGYL